MSSARIKPPEQSPGVFLIEFLKGRQRLHARLCGTMPANDLMLFGSFPISPSIRLRLNLCAPETQFQNSRICISSLREQPHCEMPELGCQSETDRLSGLVNRLAGSFSGCQNRSLQDKQNKCGFVFTLPDCSNKESPDLRRGFLFSPKNYFIRSKLFCRICQSFKPLTFSIMPRLISDSLAFLVGLLTR